MKQQPSFRKFALEPLVIEFASNLSRQIERDHDGVIVGEVSVKEHRLHSEQRERQ